MHAGDRANFQRERLKGINNLQIMCGTWPSMTPPLRMLCLRASSERPSAAAARTLPLLGRRGSTPLPAMLACRPDTSPFPLALAVLAPLMLAVLQRICASACEGPTPLGPLRFFLEGC